MSPELINAIKERLQAGQTRAEIETAVLAMGHQKEVFDAAFTLAEHDLKNNAKGALPKVTTLFVNGWNFAKSRPDLILLLLVPMVLEVLTSFYFDYNPEIDTFPPLPLLAIFIILGVAYVVTLAMTLFVVSGKDSEGTLDAAMKWTVRNALSLLFIYVLSAFVVLGGFLLFIIPGIIAVTAITFAQYVFVKEGKRGMGALLASRDLVKGRWFTVTVKILGFILLSLIPLLLLGIVYGIFETMVGESKYVTLGGEILTQLVSAVMSIINLYAMYHLYLALVESSVSSDEPSKFARARYWLLALLTLIAIVTVAALAIFFKESLKWLEEAAEPLEEMTSTMPASFNDLPEAALRFANEHEGSYAGVCETLRPLAEADGEVTCNDNETAWALEVVNGSETRFCSDTSTPGKQIYAPLGDKTECIMVAL